MDPKKEASVRGQDQTYQRSDQTSPGRKQETERNLAARKHRQKNQRGEVETGNCWTVYSPVTSYLDIDGSAHDGRRTSFATMEQS